MIKHGTEPYLECSTRGDKRFSAFYAYVGNMSIENLYQGAKLFEDGTTGLLWREAKGRRAINQAEVTLYYSQLWDMYMNDHPELMRVLLEASGVSDIFGQEGHCCPATELWRIRNRILGEYNDSGLS